jgi:hypothetical protein
MKSVIISMVINKIIDLKIYRKWIWKNIVDCVYQNKPYLTFIFYHQIEILSLVPFTCKYNFSRLLLVLMCNIYVSRLKELSKSM